MDKSSAVPLYDEVTLFSFPCGWVILIPQRTAQVLSPTGDAQHERPDLFGTVSLCAHENRPGRKHRERLFPDATIPDVNRDLMGVTLAYPCAKPFGLQKFKSLQDRLCSLSKLSKGSVVLTKIKVFSRRITQAKLYEDDRLGFHCECRRLECGFYR